MTAGSLISEQSCSVIIQVACLKLAGKIMVTGVTDNKSNLRKLDKAIAIADVDGSFVRIQHLFD